MISRRTFRFAPSVADGAGPAAKGPRKERTPRCAGSKASAPSSAPPP